MKSAAVVIKVPFHDVDSMGIVWHGNYVKYFEIARCAVLELIGYSYRQMHESGYLFPVVDLRVRYSRPVLFEQEIQVTATIMEWENRLEIQYVVTDKASGAKLTTGRSIQVAVDRHTNEMLFAAPPILVEKMGQGGS